MPGIPGVATHFHLVGKHRYLVSACGRSYVMYGTFDLDKVNCLKCRATKKFKQAKKEKKELHDGTHSGK